MNAELLGRSDLGRVRAGAVADLLLVDGDPFAEPALLWAGSERRTVIQAGMPVGR